MPGIWCSRSALGLDGEHGAEQAAGVFVHRLREHLRRGALLHHLAGVHDRDAVGQGGHQGEVVADEHHGEAELFAQPVEQVHDLLLDGDVQGGGGLVGDHQTRVAGQGHGDQHALALAAGELVRVGGERADRVELDQFQQVLGAAGPAARGELLHLRPDLHGRVQRAQGVLVDHGDLVAAQRLALRPWSSSSSSLPSNRIGPGCPRVGSSRPMTASEVMDLPQPDSPTSAMVSPGRTVKVTLSTTSMSPCRGNGWTGCAPRARCVRRDGVDEPVTRAAVPACAAVRGGLERELRGRRGDGRLDVVGAGGERQHWFRKLVEAGRDLLGARTLAEAAPAPPRRSWVASFVEAASTVSLRARVRPWRR